MIEFAEDERREMFEDHQKELLKRPYKVEVEFPEGGGMWVGVTLPEVGTIAHAIYSHRTTGKKFDREDTIGEVRDWILEVRLTEKKERNPQVAEPLRGIVNGISGGVKP